MSTSSSSSSNTKTEHKFAIQSKESDPSKAGFLYSVKNYYPEVWKQTRPTCVPFTYTHMMTTIYRMKTENMNLELSPDPLIFQMSKKGLNELNAEKTLVNKSYGLEESKGRPVRELITDFDYSETTRYTVDDFRCYDGNFAITQELVKNFGPGGKRFPIPACCHPFGSFEEKDINSKTSMENPYAWDYKIADFYHDENAIKIGRGETHMVLITGLYTRVDDPKPLDYSIEIKNSMGEEWGTGGYAWVTADIFDHINVPKFE